MTHLARICPAEGSQALKTAVSTALAVAAGTAFAQEVAGLGEVIVTATRRAERLQDVSESIAALDSAALAMRGSSVKRIPSSEIVPVPSTTS